jgi:hypothetical protein
VISDGGSYTPAPDALRAVLADITASDLLLVTAQCLRVGNLELCVALCDAWQGRSEPAIELTRAAGYFGLGQHETAIAAVDAVLREHPEHLAALFFRAQMAQHAGALSDADALLRRVLERFPDFPGAHAAFSNLQLPGPPYREVLRRVHELLRPRVYFEIGVETGATLALAKHAELIIGVDPDASKLRPELVPGAAHVFHDTSDAVFARSDDLARLLGERRIGLGLIDGLHLFEYALRDFINLERWSARDGTILIHDCLPVWPLSASRVRRSKFWVGDVWKLITILSEYRPELRVHVVRTAPSGLGVVRGLDPDSSALPAAMGEIMQRFLEQSLPSAAPDLLPGFRCVPASEAGLREALA